MPDPTVEFKLGKVYDYKVKVKITTINNLNPPHYVAVTICPITSCGKTALRESSKRKSEAYGKSLSDMRVHYEAIHIRGSHRPNRKMK